MPRGIKFTQFDDSVKDLITTKINSNPPVGKCKITNIYVDPITGKTIIEYEDTPKGA